MSEKPEKSESEADTQAGSLPEAEAGSEVAEAGGGRGARGGAGRPPAPPPPPPPRGGRQGPRCPSGPLPSAGCLRPWGGGGGCRSRR